MQREHSLGFKIEKKESRLPSERKRVGFPTKERGRVHYPWVSFPIARKRVSEPEARKQVSERKKERVSDSKKAHEKRDFKSN